LLATKPLQVFRFDSDGGETRVRTTINDLLSNQNYNIRIFANPETVGTSFNFLTFPARKILLFVFFFFSILVNINKLNLK